MTNTWFNKVKKAVQVPGAVFGATAVSISGAAAVQTDFTDIYKALENSLSLNSPTILPNTLNSTAQDKYAGHRSHSSHGSHRSHRSSGGGSYTPSKPAPKYTPSSPNFSPPTPTYSAPKTSTVPNIKSPSSPPNFSKKGTSTVPEPSSADLSQMVIRVQAALMRRGYFNGDIDGLLGPQTRAALKSFQKDKKIRQTGRMDIETLTMLGIPIS